MGAFQSSFSNISSQWAQQLTAKLAQHSGTKCVILGVGNRLKGDDAVGPLICDGLQGRIAATVIDSGTVPENHIGPVIALAPEIIVIIDAVDWGRTPGSICLVHSMQIGSGGFSTHGLSLTSLYRMFTTLLPVEILLLGIQPAGLDLMKPLCNRVEQARERIVRTLMAAVPRKKI